jgi:hypothetical protein
MIFLTDCDAEKKPRKDLKSSTGETMGKININAGNIYRWHASDVNGVQAMSMACKR